MPLKSYNTLIKETIMSLTNPSDFEILEYLEDKYSYPNLNIHTIRYYLRKLKNAKKIVECHTRSQRYSKRYSLDRHQPKSIIEPIIFKIWGDKKDIIKIAKEVKFNKEKQTIESILFIPDQIRDVVIAVKNNSLLGVIDLRYYHRPKDDVRFPSIFYKQKYQNKIYSRMTELQYFSKYVCETTKEKKNCWLTVNKWGS